ncbi:MAG: alpha/beta fold hydrolase [Actinoplanes sp.]
MDPQPALRSTQIIGGPGNLLAYDRWGMTGRPVVLLHGPLFDRTLWWPVAAELAAHCTVVAPDLPGHGQSPIRDDCSMARLADDLATLVSGLGSTRAPLVVGHGASAGLATTFADTYATHRVFAVDEPADGEVPAALRSFAEPRQDPLLLQAYASWLTAAWSAPTLLAATHLTDPAAFATSLRAHL